MLETADPTFWGFFVDAMTASHPSASLSVDVFIAYLVFCVWCVVEARRLGMRHAWAYVVWGLLVAFASAFPLFLLMRDLHLARDA